MDAECTYQQGYQIDYNPIFEENFNNNDLESLSKSHKCPGAQVKSKKLGSIKEENDVKKNQDTQRLSPSEIADRCQIGIEGKNNLICIECRPVLTGSRKSV